MVRRIQGAKNKRLLIVAHGDLDGIVSAVLLTPNLKSKDFKVEFVQPFTVDKVEVAPDDEVIVCDVAVNNRDPQMTKDFISHLGDRLLWWYDHHQGWEQIETDNRFVIDTKASSCVDVLIKYKCVGLITVSLYEDLVADATAADSRSGAPLSKRGDLIEKAIKADLSDDSIRHAAIDWLLIDQWSPDRNVIFFIYGQQLIAAANKYNAIHKETERLAADYLVTDSVALVDTRKSKNQYDLTQLLLAGQKVAPFAVVLVVNPAGQEGLTIATFRKDVNLVELFELGSGASFRVSISANRLDEVLEKLNAIGR